MKRLLAIVLSGVILASTVPLNSNAAVKAVEARIAPIAIKEEPSRNVTEPTDQGLEQVIKTVKKKIAVPEDYTEFNYYFYETNSYADSYWNLTWSNPKTNAYIQVNCNSLEHITYFYQYDNSKNATGIAKYLKSELKATADEFIKNIEPETVGRLEYIGADYEGTYSGNYVYQYQRIENGVAFPDNTVSISVNSISKEVVAASINWIYNVTIPTKETKITIEQATKLIKENMKMKLVYRSDYYNIYKESSDETKKAFLVYEPSESYISVDAKTGKVYLTKSEWVDTGARNESSKADATADMANGSTTEALTKEEITKVEELKSLISKSNAIKTITSNTNLYLDENLKSYSATLYKQENRNEETTYVWNVELSDPREINYETDTDYYRAYAYATVDAKTGKILSFYASTKSYYDEKNQKWETVKIPYTKENAKELLEKFLKTQTKERFENTVLVSQNDDYVAYYKDSTPVYGGYSYQYNRVNEGIEYPYNSIYGSVDGVTGKIYSYGTNWDDSIVFESPKGAMSADKAMDCYLSKEGYALQYEINVINKLDADKKSPDGYYDNSKAYSVEYEIRLVYYPNISPSYLSPFTGEQLDSNGEVYKETAPYTYLDIASISDNRNILLLSDMNIGFKGENFLPSKEINLGELNEILEEVGYGYSIAIEDDSNKNSLITREAAAKVFIEKLGLEKVSKLEGIYKTGYADENLIAKEYLGAVALAKGYGLMDAASGNNFKPNEKVTRYEAVEMIMNFIEVQQAGNN